MSKARTFVALVVVAALVPSSAVATEFTFVGQFGSVGGGPGQFQNPDDVAVDSAGFVYVADSGNNRIQKFSADGVFQFAFGSSGGGAGQLAGANAVAVDPAAANVYVADRNNHRAMQFTSAGTFVQGWGWAVDTGASQFQVCTTASTCNIGTPGSSTTNNGQLNTPTAIAVDASGDVYVSEFFGDQRIQRFNPSPVTYEAGWGQPCSVGPPCTGPGEFARPIGLALDSTPNVFVADRDNSRVQKFTSGGGFLASIGSDGPGPGQMDSAKDVAIDPAGNLFVADPINARVQKFTGQGVFLDSYTLTPPDFVHPAALAFSASGDLYVIDSASGHNFRILRLRDPAAGQPPPPPPPPPPPEDLPAPVLGKSVNVRLIRGTVLIGIPSGAGSARAAQKGVRFEPLTEARQIPVGSFLDTKKGTVGLTSAANDQGATQSGNFTKGLFQVLQGRSATTELRMKGSSFNRCRSTGRRASAARKRLTSRTVRRLQGDAQGLFRTRGRHSAATVRGTIWTVTDRCDGTLTKVRRGSVAVRDFRRKRTIVVRAGKQYLARAQR